MVPGFKVPFSFPFSQVIESTLDIAVFRKVLLFLHGSSFLIGVASIVFPDSPFASGSLVGKFYCLWCKSEF